MRDLEDLALQQSGSDDLTTQIKQLEVGAAAVPLKGPGLTLTIDDAPSVDADANAGSRPSSGFQEGRVTSGDLQIIVNGLWGAGAEAIAINGHRLSSTAAIRFAGQAIIVDFRPLARPYVITALGDPQGMQQIFEPSFAGVYLDQLTQEFQIRSSLSRPPTTSPCRVTPLDHAHRPRAAAVRRRGLGRPPSRVRSIPPTHERTPDPEETQP